MDTQSSQTKSLAPQGPKKFRPEIEGLRAVAAFLVAVYHIWLGRVSGGVDVFFVVSGFLITASLVSRYRRLGTVNFFDYLFGLFKRLFPAAFFVLAVVTVISYVVLPTIRWDQTVQELLASALYFQNWELAFSAVDYLDSANDKSPVQHFWAMSIQAQFYVIWFFLITLAIFWVKRTQTTDIKPTLLKIFVAVFIPSLAYSIWMTQYNQPWAYFDTFARVWEFSLGGILFLTITKIRLSPLVSTVVGWFGFLALVSVGVVLDVGGVFPGYVALWPTMAAVMILVAGENGGTYGVQRFLGSKPLAKLGGLSYGFYLWHWPLLMFYYAIFGVERVSIVDGILIILLSLALSYVTTSIVERPIRKIKTKTNYHPKVIGALLAFMLPVLALNFAWQLKIEAEQQEQLALASSPDYPGALVFTEAYQDTPERPYIPFDSEITNDRPIPFFDGCHIGVPETDVVTCEYGDTENPEYKVALVGGSHSSHWHPALDTFIEEENILLMNMTKSACRLSTESRSDYPECNEWNKNIIDAIVEADVDLVVTTADIGQKNSKEVPAGYVEQFRALESNNIPVFAIRDTPFFDRKVPECLAEFGRDAEECSVEREKTLPAVSDWERLEDKPSNVYYYDYSDYICEDDVCRPVVGNIVGYSDSNHMTKSFSESLGSFVREDMIALLNQLVE
ncbi:acyltransferase family protein [Exiguobacterium sp. SL-9]|uniref:acyltransferase family protein n=1 Tax=Exiguobacterium sp. SL-9 TaxID=2510963 RepID=UPI00103A7AC5|nr:acyltransferase family protein [Exiguobacterium sp. SL-9]TCI22536.1 acyltransferase [Exiguobacterium sp. SL-9]